MRTLNEISIFIFATVVGFLVLVAVCVGLVLLALAILPDHVQNPPNPSSTELVIANRWVIWLIRLCGLAVVVMFVVFALYFIRSIRHRMRHGHWLRSGTGLEAEIVNAIDDFEPLLGALSASEERVVELEGQPTESKDVIQQLAGILNLLPEQDVQEAVRQHAEQTGGTSEA